MKPFRLDRPIPYSDDVEVIPPDEAEDVRNVIEALEKILKHSRQASGQFQADVHVKSDGCARAEFRVLPNLPAELAQGLFEKDRTYQAIVRFSNAAGQRKADLAPDGRGMAIKVLGVEGEAATSDDYGGRTQDFIMINHPIFVAGTVKDYLRLEELLADAGDDPFATLRGVLMGGHLNPLRWHWRETFTAARIAGHLPSHPAGNTYFSMAPVRYGKYVAKYRAKPAGEIPDTLIDVLRSLAKDPNALRLMLEETLRAQQLLFEFQVQLRTTETSMPIENTSIEWSEKESAFRTVALLLLPRQEVGSQQQIDARKSLSFNVWHALAAHRPLGGLNRLRREAYRVSSAWRHQLSGIEQREPVSIDALF